MRSPRGSSSVTARRVGSSTVAAWTSTSSSGSRPRVLRAGSSSPSAVNRFDAPARRASWTAATAPPPAGSSKGLVAWTTSPATGTCSTPANWTHSTWPTTATRGAAACTGASLTHERARFRDGALPGTRTDGDEQPRREGGRACARPQPGPAGGPHVRAPAWARGSQRRSDLGARPGRATHRLGPQARRRTGAVRPRLQSPGVRPRVPDGRALPAGAVVRRRAPRRRRHASGQRRRPVPGDRDAARLGWQQELLRGHHRGRERQRNLRLQQRLLRRTGLRGDQLQRPRLGRFVRHRGIARRHPARAKKASSAWPTSATRPATPSTCSGCSRTKDSSSRRTSASPGSPTAAGRASSWPI